MSVLDPIEAIGGVGGKSHIQQGTHVSIKSKDSDFLYKFNYVIAVMNLTQLCMKHQQDVVAIRSKLAEITTKIQSDLNILSQTMTTFQNNANPSGGDSSNPNYYNGFGQNGQFLLLQGTFGGTTEVQPSAALTAATTAELHAFSDLFCVGPTSSASDVKLSDLMQIDNPTNPGQPFDLSHFWSSVENSYDSKGYAGMITATNLNARPSLIQQYTYWQAKLNLSQTSPDDIKAAGGDFTKIPGMNFKPTDDSFDPNINNMLSVYTSLNQNPNASAVQQGDWGEWGNFGNETYLQLLKRAIDTPDVSIDNVYLADSHMTFNYFWTKDPQAKDGAGASNRAHQADILSDIYSHVSSTQASLSSASSAQGTNFQQDTSGMTTETNEVQQIISSFMQGQGSLVGNFKSG